MSWYFWIITSMKEVMFLLLFVCLSVCLFVSSFVRKLPKGFAWNFQGRSQWAIEQMVKFWRQSRSPSGYRDCFLDLSLLGDMESGINQLRCTVLQCRACTSRHHNSMYDVIMSPAHDISCVRFMRMSMYFIILLSVLVFYFLLFCKHVRLSCVFLSKLTYLNLLT